MRIPALRSSLSGALVATAIGLVACETRDRSSDTLPTPPARGSLDLPPKEALANPDAPPVPEPCKHRWDADRFGTHSFTVYEDGVPVVKLCTPIVCSKCGLVRHECEKELRRRAR